jgi:translation initiation factor IF-3
LIDHLGNQIGIVETKQALQMAREVGQDLVEVAPTSRPPVCRIMDFGKFKYDQKKKDRKTKATRHETELKVVRIRTPKIGEHDLGIKIQHARDFLSRGDRVQFTMLFRGREMAHQDLGREKLNLVKTALVDCAKVEHDFSMEGRAVSILLGPIGKAALGKPSKPKAPKPPKPKAGGLDAVAAPGAPGAPGAVPAVAGAAPTVAGAAPAVAAVTPADAAQPAAVASPVTAVTPAAPAEPAAVAAPATTPAPTEGK